MRHQVTAPKIVQEKEAWKFWLKFAVFLVMILLVGLYAFDYGREHAGFDIGKAKAEKSKTKKRINALVDEIDVLTKQVALVERTAQIDQKSVELIKQDLKILSDENAGLKDEVAFFKGIVAPETQEKGMHVQSFQIKATDTSRHYSYRIILTRFGKYKKASEGVVKIRIKGVLDGKEKTLKLTRIGSKKAINHPYKFKYFKRISGEIRLPKGFSPGFVDIIVDPKGTWPKVSTEKYVWVVAGQ